MLTKKKKTQSLTTISSISAFIATLSSATCFIHCLLTPLFIIIMPSLSSVLFNHHLEIGLLVVSILFGILTIIIGYRSHKRKQPIIVFTIGAIIWISHSISEHFFHNHGNLLLIILGTFFVCSSYIINHHYTRCHQNC